MLRSFRSTSVVWYCIGRSLVSWSPHSHATSLCWLRLSTNWRYSRQHIDRLQWAIAPSAANFGCECCLPGGKRYPDHTGLGAGKCVTRKGWRSFGCWWLLHCHEYFYSSASERSEMLKFQKLQIIQPYWSLILCLYINFKCKTMQKISTGSRFVDMYVP